MGVGSEVYGALLNDRKAIGIELKAGYYRQAVKNIQGLSLRPQQQDTLLFEDDVITSSLTDRTVEELRRFIFGMRD